MSKWININDRMPDPIFDWVLVFQDGAMCAMAYSSDKGFYMPYPFNDRVNLAISEITHWQPLPESPE